MNVKELIKELQKLPQDLEVRYAIEKGRGRRTLCAINKTEVYEKTIVMMMNLGKEVES